MKGRKAMEAVSVMVQSGQRRADDCGSMRFYRSYLRVVPLVFVLISIAIHSTAAQEALPAAYSYEIRGGLLRHDIGLFGNSVERSWDANVEILFAAPGVLAALGSPHPHLGSSIDLGGKTSQVYTGLTWRIDLPNSFFTEFTAGGSLNNGNLDKSDPNRKDLGSHLAFRESVSIGYRLTTRSNVLLTVDHISNAGLASYNGGMENFGIRYGYRY